MEIKELSANEMLTISGGNEFTDSFWFTVGLISRGFYEFSKGSSSGGYAYGKTGLR